MAYATVTLTHPESQATRKAPVGFSWTTFFFGFFPALLRGHALGALGMFALCIVTFGLAPIVMAFFYNKWYLNSLVKQGYAVESVDRNADKVSEKLGLDFPAGLSAA